MALHIFELSKSRKSVDELATPLDRWLFFLRHGENLDPDALPEPLNVPDVRWALGDLLMISQSDREREQLQTLSPHELANLVDRLQAELDTKLALLSE